MNKLCKLVYGIYIDETFVFEIDEITEEYVKYQDQSNQTTYCEIKTILGKSLIRKDSIREIETGKFFEGKPMFVDKNNFNFKYKRFTGRRVNPHYTSNDVDFDVDFKNLTKDHEYIYEIVVPTWFGLFEKTIWRSLTELYILEKE